MTKRVAGSRRRTARVPAAHDPAMLAALPEWLTRDQAARLLRVTTKTVDRMRADGRLTTYRREGGRAFRPVLVKRDDVRQLIEIGPQLQTHHAGPEAV